MVLINSIKKIMDDNNDQNPFYLRNLIKEELQNYILNFVYSSRDYNKLIFTGGTCLRKVYGLNRLSEDLDFDYLNEFDIRQFAVDVTKYFSSVVQYEEISYSISGNNKTAYFKLPLLKELGVYTNRTPEDIFVRCDFSKEEKGGYGLDKNMINAGTFQFFVTSYDLSTLFANKIVAFLDRVFYKGKSQKLPFKGRDVYDLYWLVQLAAKSSYKLKVNKNRLMALLKNKSVKEIKIEVRQKIKAIDPKYLYQDLLPLLESRQVLEVFVSSYSKYVPKYLDFVL